MTEHNPNQPFADNIARMLADKLKEETGETWYVQGNCQNLDIQWTASAYPGQFSWKTAHWDVVYGEDAINTVRDWIEQQVTGITHMYWKALAREHNAPSYSLHDKFPLIGDPPHFYKDYDIPWKDSQDG